MFDFLHKNKAQTRKASHTAIMHTLSRWWRTRSSLIFVGIFFCAALWVMVVWYQLFQVNVLVADEISAVRAEHSGATFDREAFDAVVDREKERARVLENDIRYQGRDVFFPDAYTPARDTDR